ncbi:MFS transporter [Paeniglutamicibacter sp. NPDC091659]|uniref:MFS transporter n=1 Tax=Paeniglutamicibacter sp. NPDC091659 TaxID=3364389 RepID=UPI0037F19DDE
MTSHERVVLWVAILSSFVAFLDGSIVNVALPAIAADLGGGLATQQWVLDGYLLTLGSLILVAGALSDIYGRVHVLRTGLVLFGLASLLCAVAPTGPVLVAARLLQGAEGALLVPSSLALITSTFQEEPRARDIGLWTGWTGTAFIVGPVLGGVLVDTIGWRWVFGINVVPIAATMLLLAGLHDPARGSATTHVDIPGALLAALGLAGTVYALIMQGTLGWGSSLVLAPFAAGLACLAGFIWWQARATHPMMPLGLFRIRNFGVGNLATAAVYAGLSLGLFIIPIFLQEVAAFSALAAGLATIPLTIMSLSFSTLFGTLAGKHGPRLFMGLGPLLGGCGFLLMLTSRDPLDYWWQVLPGVVLFGLGLSITVAPLTAAVLGSIAADRSGIGSAINNAVARVAGLVAVAAMGTIVGTTLDYDSFHRVLLVTAVLLYAGAAISAIGIRNPPVPAPAVAPEAAAACHDRNVNGGPRP